MRDITENIGVAKAIIVYLVLLTGILVSWLVVVWCLSHPIGLSQFWVAFCIGSQLATVWLYFKFLYDLMDKENVKTMKSELERLKKLEKEIKEIFDKEEKDDCL